MQRFADFANCEKRTGTGFIDFDRLIAALTLHQPDQSIQDLQRRIGRRRLGRCQSSKGLLSFLRLRHIDLI